ncbi:uncharacterized protein G2W53_011362 [Senna tora]|uniref:Uncharacterized protein n=1 Tax=Senna tora TaxID=362788 RepID=A0A834X2U8_9FABA|nr:uncharacterized protein G2W53_011362 [Senna tora]
MEEAMDAIASHSLPPRNFNFNLNLQSAISLEKQRNGKKKKRTESIGN